MQAGKMSPGEPGAAHFPLEFWGGGGQECHVGLWDQNSAEPGLLLKKQQLLPRHELELCDRRWHWHSQVSFTNPHRSAISARMRDSLLSSLGTCLDLCVHELGQYIWYSTSKGLKSCALQDCSPPLNTSTVLSRSCLARRKTKQPQNLSPFFPS